MKTRRSSLPCSPERSASGVRHGLSVLTACLVALAFVLLPSLAAAAPAEVPVRIEGKAQTLFEGPVLTDGHRVKAASDRDWRKCDATNNNMSSTPGPTPTAAADDAMRTIGHDFDAQWYPGFEDYFIQRFGPDRDSADDYEYWGILVNGTFTSVGGCQKKLGTGDQVLWVYDAFTDRRMLRLSVEKSDGSVGNPVEAWLSAVPVVRVGAGEQFTFRVESYTGAMDGSSQNAEVEEGLGVFPVATAANGFQTVSGTPIGTSDASGEASHSLNIPGWHRFKVESEADFVRSNRIDVCVEPCPAPPPDVTLRIPPPPDEDPDDPPPPDGDDDQNGEDRAGPRIQRPHFVPGPNRRGQIGLRWKVLHPGVGVRSWLVESRRLGGARAGWITRARGGRDGNFAAFRLPVASTHLIRFTVIDDLGRRAGVRVGRASALLDERERRVRLRGRWHAKRDRLAWRGMTVRGGRGATVRAWLPEGRPVIVLRNVHRTARVLVRAGGRARVYQIAARRGPVSREIVTPRRGKPGPVTLRVLRGRVDLDGLTTRP